jgi:capsular polysaccharide biosynthesis protein
MDLLALSRMILRRGWIVVLLAGFGAVAGLAFAQTRTPVYEAVTAVRLQPARPADLGQTNAIKEAMRSYQRDIKTYDLADAVLARLCGDEDEVSQRLCRERDAGSIRGMIHVGIDPNVFEIQVKARAEDPAEAVKVSEQTAHAFVDRRETANLQLDLRDRVLAGIRDEPQPALHSPRRKLLVAAGAALGMALGAALVLLLEYLDRAVVRGAADAERLCGAPVVATVPPSATGSTGRRRAWRTGARDLRSALGHLGRVGLPVLLMALLGAAAAFAFSAVQPKTYVARTRIAVEPALGSDWGQSLAIREITRGFSRDITTRNMAARVSERMQADLPPAALLEQINVAEDVDVYEITIEALDPIAENAAAISRTWAELFVEQRRTANLELDQRDRILTRLRDRTLTEVWAPKTSSNVLAGAVLGALVGAVAVLLLRMARRGTIETAEDARRSARAPLLGTIPPAGRRG